MTYSNGIADPNPKIKRAAFALTEEQHQLVREACRRIGWTHSQLHRHSSIVLAQSILTSPALEDGGLVIAITPPPTAGLASSRS
jgi:hypothetical protein